MREYEMDFKQYGGIPIRVKQIVNEYRNKGTLSDDHCFLLKEFAEILMKVLDEADSLQEQLKEHEELSKLLAEFGTCVGSLGAAQCVPTPSVDHMVHQRDAVPPLFGDREEWISPVHPDRSKAWPFVKSDVEGKVGHTQFMKLSERVDELEKRLARIQGFSDGRL
jgi:hypothetical protein